MGQDGHHQHPSHANEMRKSRRNLSQAKDKRKSQRAVGTNRERTEINTTSGQQKTQRRAGGRSGASREKPAKQRRQGRTGRRRGPTGSRRARPTSQPDKRYKGQSEGGGVQHDEDRDSRIFIQMTGKASGGGNRAKPGKKTIGRSREYGLGGESTGGG